MNQSEIPNWVWFSLIAIVFVEIALGWFRGRWSLYQRRAVSLRAKRAEKHARGVLEREGYRVLDAQADCRWPVVVDGRLLETRLRADLIVERRGRRYVAEVKTGETETNIRCSETRRQLLEYFLAFDVDGVLLVDMNEERVSEVAFPSLVRSTRAA